MFRLNIRRGAVAVVFLLTGLFSFSYGQGRNSSISGFVFDLDRFPISQVVVELQSEFSTIARSRTDGSGRYMFRGLAHGRYTVKVMPLGTNYMEQTQDVEIAGIGVRGQALAENVQLDIYLKPRKTSATTPFQNAVLFAQEVPSSAQSLYEKAITDLENGKAETGINSLEKAIDLFPEYFMALQRLGLIRLAQERFEDAITIFHKAVDVNSRSADCWYGLSYAQYSIRKFNEAKVSAEKAITNKPELMEAHVLLGIANRSLKDYIGAEKALKQALKLSENGAADVHWQLSLLYSKDMNRFADAAKELKSYLKLTPDAPNKKEIEKLIKQFEEKGKSGN